MLVEEISAFSMHAVKRNARSQNSRIRFLSDVVVQAVSALSARATKRCARPKDARICFLNGVLAIQLMSADLRE